MDAFPTILTGGIAGLVVAALMLVLPWFVGRSAEIAAERRSRYPKIANALIASWRKGGLGERDALLATLGELVIDSNPALVGPIEGVMVALSAGTDVPAALGTLIEAMRSSAMLGNVRHNYSGFGRSQAALITKLLEP